VSVKVRRWWWSDPLYDVSVLLLKCPADKAAAALLRIFDGDDGEFGTFTGAKTLWIQRDKGCAIAIWVPEWWTAKSSHHLSVLAHECFHAAEFVMRERGMTLTDASDEAYAYYIAWMFRNCHERLTK
jgi:hypothetical protein